LLVNSGSSANLLAFATLTSSQIDRPLRPGDEVLTVAAGFPTTVAPIVQYGCVPVFVDVQAETANARMDRLADAVGPKTRAIMMAHTLGNPFNLAADKGLATFDVRNVGVINAIYELPFGHGKMYASALERWKNGLVGGWLVASIVTAQSGFPFTPQLSYNPSNNGDTRNPVRPFLNPNFKGSVVTANPNQWFNPAAFIAPPSASGFFGNAGRDTYIGPGLATWDFSFL